MPTKKPRIQTILDEIDYKKFQYLCKQENRTESKLASLIIKEYLKEYENIYGEIKIEEQKRKNNINVQNSSGIVIGNNNSGIIIKNSTN